MRMLGRIYAQWREDKGGLGGENRVGWAEYGRGLHGAVRVGVKGGKA